MESLPSAPCHCCGLRWCREIWKPWYRLWRGKNDHGPCWCGTLGGKTSHVGHRQVLQCLSMGTGLSQKKWCSQFSSKAIKCVTWLFWWSLINKSLDITWDANTWMVILTQISLYRSLSRFIFIAGKHRSKAAEGTIPVLSLHLCHLRYFHRWGTAFSSSELWRRGGYSLCLFYWSDVWNNGQH